MALFRSIFQITSKRFNTFSFFNETCKAPAQQCQNPTCMEKKYFWSWCSCGKNPPKVEKEVCKPDNVVCNSSCRKRLPQCPEFIDTGKPSKCLEPGYGKRIKIGWFKKGPIKKKPSNCEVKCKEPETFWEYIFGPQPPPLPEPLTCRKSYKLAQLHIRNDPRLKDPRYSETAGDVLLFTGPLKLEKCYYPGPKPRCPPPFLPPNSVITKRFSDSLSNLDCYCPSAKPTETCCSENLCPVHKSKPKVRILFEEMRPKIKHKDIFTCTEGIETKDVAVPGRRESCSCSENKAFERKHVVPSPKSNAISDALRRCSAQIPKVATVDKHDNFKLSRNERLKMVMSQKEKERLQPPRSRCGG